MINLQIGKKCDGAFEKFIDGTDTIKIAKLSSFPLFGFITLTGVREAEKELFNKKLTVALSVVDNIPFLIFDFDGAMSFDAAIRDVGVLNPEENAFNLVLIENNNSVIYGMRTLGLDRNILKKLVIAIEKLNLTIIEFSEKVRAIQMQYSTKELLQKAELIQIFDKVK